MVKATRLRRSGRLSFVLGAVLFAVLFVTSAIADDISNNLDATADAVAETMPLTVGGANGTTRVYVVPQNGDGKNGCNLTGSTTATISLASSDTSVATVSPSSITFTSCVSSTTGPIVTVHPVAQGTTTISATLTGNSTGAAFVVAPVTFTVNVSPPPNTPPHVSVVGVTGGASYNKGSVPAASCQVTDTEDGNSSFAATLSAIVGPNASDGIGEQEASCSYTDAGGLMASSSVTYGIVDPSAPTIISLVTPLTPNGNNGWYTGNVSLDWTVSEPQSPGSLVKTGCVDQSITTDQAATTYSCSATSAGGSAGPVNVTIKRDGSEPTITADSGSYTSGDWTNDDVTVTFTCADVGPSGLADPCPADAVLSAETSGTPVSRTISDNAGNNGTSNQITVKIDKTKPVLSLPSNITGKEATGPSGAAVSYSASASDALSGLNGAIDCSPASGSTFALGTTTVNCSAEDNAGNGQSGSFSVTVVDTTPPSLNLPDNITKEATGPSGAAATFSATASDLVDGSVAVDCDHNSGSTFPLGTTTVHCSATDAHTNVANGSFTITVQDTTAPTLNLPSNMTVNSPSNSQAVVTYSASANDIVDGSVAISCSPASGSTFAVGTTTVNCSATDAHNNTATGSFTVSVVYVWTGFFQPVDNLSTENVVKAGSAIPVKFSLGGNQGLNILASGSPSSVVYPCGSAAGDDPIELTVTAGSSSLQYDATANQYIYVWKTDKNWGGQCRQLRVKLADGTLHAANFKFTK